jgi:uncharacterized protein YjbI with pentapeptide repeats
VVPDSGSRDALRAKAAAASTPVVNLLPHAGANLTFADLGQANLKKADLTNAILEGAIVSSTIFDDVIIIGTDFTGTIIRKVRRLT